jgi:parallel beta-helix repeat protein
MGGTPQPNGVPNSYNTILGNTVWDTGRYTPAGAETNLDGIGFLASGPANVVCVSGNNKVMKNNVLANRRDGIFVGGRANSGNLIMGNSARGNWRNGITASLGGPGWGNPPNQFMQNSGSGNGVMDATDLNPNCGGDVWSANTFAKVAPACVQ